MNEDDSTSGLDPNIVLSEPEAIGADDNEKLTSVLGRELTLALVIEEMSAAIVSLRGSMLEDSDNDSTVELSESAEAELESKSNDASDLAVTGLEYGLSSEPVH